MRQTKHTPLVQELMRRGLSYKNAYRIIYQSTGQASRILRDVLQELLSLQDQGKK